jgi:hypothetical protein
LYGIDDAFAKLNYRTVGQIFSEYHPRDERPIVSGDLEGVHFELYAGGSVDREKQRSRRQGEGRPSRQKPKKKP